MPTNEKKAHPYPQMTVEALARYLTTSNPATRRSILKDQKFYDSVTQPPYYREVKSALVRHLLDDQRDDAGLLAAAKRFSPEPTATDYEKARLANNVAALKLLHECREEFVTGELAYTKASSLRSMELAGVKVIASPVLGLSGDYREQECAGSLKLVLDKQHPLDAAAAGYIGAAMISFATLLNPSRDCLPRHVLIVDVFRSRAFRGPASTKKRINEITIACSDIARVWDQLEL